MLFIVVLIINVPVEYFQLGHQSEKLDLGGKTFYKNISHLGIEILTFYVLLLRKGLKKKLEFPFLFEDQYQTELVSWIVDHFSIFPSFILNTNFLS